MTESKTFAGRVISGDGDPLEVEVVVERDQIRMTSSSTEIAVWPVDGCHLERAGDEGFDIGEDGDAVHFEPDDVAGFGEVVEHVAAGTLAGLFVPAPASDTAWAEPDLPDSESELPVTQSADTSRAEPDLSSAAPELPVPLDGSGPFEIDVTLAGDPGSEIQIDPGPEDAGVGTGYLDTVAEVDLGFLPNTPREVEEAGEEAEVDDHADELLEPDAADEANDGLSADVGGSDHGEGESRGAEDDPVVEFEGTPEESELIGSDESGADGSPGSEIADEAAVGEDPAPSVIDAPAGEVIENTDDTSAGDGAEEHDRAPVEASLTDRIKSLGTENDDDGSELRRSFGQRLSRRRVAASPPPSPAGIDPATARAADDPPGPADGSDELSAGSEGIDLEAISAGVAPAEPVSDTAALAAAVDALREHAEPAEFAGTTVADTILEAQRSLRSSSSKASELPSRLKKAALFLGAVILLGGLGLGGYLAFQLLVSSDPDTPPATTLAAGATTVPSVTAPPATALPTTTAVPTTTIPPQPTAFELSAPEFVARWNDTADEFNPVLRLPSLLPGDFEFELTPYIAAVGSVGDGGSIDQISLLIDPSGPTDSDVLGIQAMGMMIAAVDPNLSGPERKALLAAMGFDVENPALVGVDGLSARNGVEYRLIFDNEAVELRFTASAA